MGDDETQRFEADERVTGAGYRLAAAWGPSRWRVGGAGPAVATVRSAAYAPDGETVYFAAGRAIVQVDREGRRVREPCAIGADEGCISFAEGGGRAAIVKDRRALTVVDLPTMREVFVGDAGGAYAAQLSGDGSVVACGARVQRVSDGAVLDEVRGRELLALSYDGALALYAERAARGYDVTVALRAVGGADVRSERAREGISWHAAFSRDGRFVAWGRYHDLVCWDASKPDARFAGGRDALGPIAFVGHDLLAYINGAVVRLGPDGRARDSIPARAGWILCTSPSGDRVLLRGPPEPVELDLARRALLEAPREAFAEVTRVAWDAEGRRALVLRADGDLRIWDAVAWKTERVLDPERALLRRTPPIAGYAAWNFRSERVCPSFSRDGAHVIASDAAGAVVLLNREGVPVWRREFEPDPAWGGGYAWHSSWQEESDAGLEVHALWSRDGRYEPDGTPVEDLRRTLTVLDLRDGSIRSQREVPHEPYSGPPPPLPPVHLVLRGAGGEVRVDDDVLPVPDQLGHPTGVYSSRDERTLLVATNGRLLLRYDRVP